MSEKRFCRFLFTDHDDHTVHYGVKDCQTDEFYSAEDNRNANKLLELLNNLHDENEQLSKDATTLIYANKEYREEIKFLKNKVKTYKVANQLLKESLNKTKKYRDVLMNFDESKTIKIDKNNGTIELIDKEWK